MQEETKITENKIFLFHPTTIIVMFILDWGGFVFEIPQFFNPFTLFITFIALFSISGIASYFLQKHFAGEDTKTATLKAALAGLICAVPAPMMSGIVGSIILALSGFEAVKDKGIDGLIEMFKAKG
jgi:hypothetical protein